MKTYGLIMAGGGGTRFWPLSRKDIPKQFLNISGNDVMINEAILRIDKNIKHEDTYIVTNANQKYALEEVLCSDINRNNIFYEPLGKNTAACICYSAISLYKKSGDGVLCIFPSDHFIQNKEAFNETLKLCIDNAANTDNIVTIGIKPTFPSTGYGYIKFNKNNLDKDGLVYTVLEFVEKPNFEKAKEYVESKNYYWNSGMFICKLSTIINSFKQFLPKLYNKFQSIYEYIGTEDESEKLMEVYKEIPSISIDYGILERSDKVLTVTGDFGWNDVGSWDALGSIFYPDKNANIIKAEHIGINTNNSIIFSNNRLVTTIGIDDIIIADTKDALLVCKKDNAQDVKLIVDKLKEKGLEKYL